MRVLFIVAGDRHVSGVVRYDHEVITGLGEPGLDVQVFTPSMILNRDGKSQLTDTKYLWSEVGNSLSLWGRRAKDAFRPWWRCART